MNIFHFKKEKMERLPSSLSSSSRKKRVHEKLYHSIVPVKGFTLLEVLIALAIFAIVGTVSLQIYLSSVRHVQITTEQKNSILLSTLKIEELKIEMEEGVKEDSGSFDEPFENYEWSLKLSDLSITDTEYDLIFIPYKLILDSGNIRFSTLTPFLQTEEKDVEILNE
jgi:prepilin-type N-terminal cleavage/methylation domain-containing protein